MTTTMSHSALYFNLQAPKPPSREETNADPALSLRWVTDRIAEIYSFERPNQQRDSTEAPTAALTQRAYLDIHNAVFNYCIATKYVDKTQQNRGAALNGEDLYRSLEQAIKSYCQECLAHINAAPNVHDVLEAYTEQWTIFLEMSRRAGGLFSFLFRHWARRAMDERKHERIYGVDELHMVMWKGEVLLSDRSTKVLDAMVDLQQQDSGLQLPECGDSKRLLEDSMASLRQVGLTLSNGSFVTLEQ